MRNTGANTTPDSNGAPEHPAENAPPQEAQSPALPDAVGTEDYSLADHKKLLELALHSLQECVASGRLPSVAPGEFSPALRARKACFVTLTKHGKLRGCIGTLTAREPLYQAVMECARGAALRDTRFPAVTPRELPELRVEISILTEPTPLTFETPLELLQKLRPYEDGVVLCLGNHSATFLPQVWESIPDKTEFLDRLAVKAGGAPSDWRLPGVTVSTYRVRKIQSRYETAAGSD